MMGNKKEGKEPGVVIKKMDSATTKFEKVPPFNAVDADRIGKDIGKDRV